MPKLFQVNVEANYGSTGRIASGIGDLALNEGWESYIAYGQKHASSSSELIKVGNNLQFYEHALQTRLFDRHGLSSSTATKGLIKSIETIGPDIIHLHNIHGYYLNYPILFSFLRRLNIPLVWTLHDCWAITGHCTHFENIGCQKWQTNCHSCPQKKIYPASIFIDRSRKNHLDKKKYFLLPEKIEIVTVSNWLNRIIGMSFLSNYPRTTIHNGINLNVFQPVQDSILREQYGLQNSIILLGVASKWTENKGLGDFIALSKELDAQERIVLIGLSSSQIKNLPENIIGLERTQNIEELASWYSMADVYINTSVEESFGMTTVEAMACGTPVVVYDATACPEMVNEKVGEVVAKNNVDELHKAVKSILSKGKPEYSRNCRELVEKNFNKNDRFRDYLSLYKKSLNIEN